MNDEPLREYLASLLAAKAVHCDTCTCTGGFEYQLARARAIMTGEPIPPTPAQQAEICGLSGNYGAFLEPLACAYPKGHVGPHAFASLPTFVNGKAVSS